MCCAIDTTQQAAQCTTITTDAFDTAQRETFQQRRLMTKPQLPRPSMRSMLEPTLSQAVIHREECTCRCANSAVDSCLCCSTASLTLFTSPAPLEASARAADRAASDVATACTEQQQRRRQRQQRHSRARSQRAQASRWLCSCRA